MPFTPAHAVVAIPFARTPLVPAAIAVGAMAPDIPLFFRAGLPYDVTHDWLLGPIVGIPLAFVLLLIWRMLLRPAVPHLTPRWFAQRWPQRWSELSDGWWTLWGGRRASPGRRIGAAALLVAALVLGIATHIFWDSFTHTGRWGGVLFPVLDEWFYGNELANWLHYLSSVFGLTTIAIWGLLWLRRQSPRPTPPVMPDWFRVAVWLALPACLLVSMAITLALRGWEGPTFTIARAGTAGGSAILIVLVLASAVIVARKARHARDSADLREPGEHP